MRQRKVVFPVLVAAATAVLVASSITVTAAPSGRSTLTGSVPAWASSKNFKAAVNCWSARSSQADNAVNAGKNKAVVFVAGCLRASRISNCQTSSWQARIRDQPVRFERKICRCKRLHIGQQSKRSVDE